MIIKLAIDSRGMRSINIMISVDSSGSQIFVPILNYEFGLA
jgi:hypothetical protein